MSSDDILARLTDAYESLCDIGGAWERDVVKDAADVIEARDAENVRLRAEVERLRVERDDHKARLAIEAFTAPDADFDTMMDSLQARLRDLHDKIKLLQAAGDALAEYLMRAWRSDAASDLVDAWKEARREQ